MSRLIETRTEEIDSKINRDMLSDSLRKLIVIRSIDDNLCFFEFNDNKLASINVFNEKSLDGSIIIGRINAVKKDINAAFINLDEDTVAFLKLENVPDRYLPLHQGDLIPVKKIADNQKGKRISVSANISPKRIDENWTHKAAYSKLNDMNPLDSFLINNYELNQIEIITTDDSKAFDSFNSCSLIEQNNIKVNLYIDNSFSLMQLYSLKTKISEALSSKVYLKNGGYLIINRTEALNVIDVNSGKVVHSKKVDFESNAFDVNKEAAIEAAHQIILRNMSGMILIDFINMESDENKNELLNLMNSLLESKKIKAMVIDITPLGIMEVTRQKKNKPLYELDSIISLLK